MIDHGKVEMSAAPFCVIEKPYMVWGHDVRRDNELFLKRIDANLYYRMAHDILGAPQADSADDADAAMAEDDDDQARKDNSSLSRLLWHHGMETLIMMLGAYIQAPAIAHAYFLKCKTEDAIQMGGFLLREECPKYHRLQGAPFSLRSLLGGIHAGAGWTNFDVTIEHFTNALRNMLSDYVEEKHRSEYNSIKHGLRASHGRFSLAFGQQEAPGVPAPPEAMQMLGTSRDSSSFEVAKRPKNATNQQAKINFLTETVSVSWSLERVLIELQLLSLLIHNTVSALRIANGADASSVPFSKIVDDETFWEAYANLRESPIMSASFGTVIDAKEIALATDKKVFQSYGAGGRT